MSTADWSITRAYKAQEPNLLLCNVIGVFTLLYILSSDDLKALVIPNREGRTKLFKKIEKRSRKYRKNNNAAILIEIFNIPTLLVVISTSHRYYFTMPTRVKLYILLDVVLYRVNAIAFKLGVSTN